MKKLFDTIKATLDSKPCAIIAVDGMCASGKTTLANRLAEEYGFEVIHTDDFFLPFDMRTEERLSQPGGNIHYERFIKEVIIPLKENRDLEYNVFNCSSGTYGKKRKILHGKPVIIEGAYSMHPGIPDIYDLKIFLQISHVLQLERIKKRNGTQALEVFKEKWIPFETVYFETFGIREKCDIVTEVEIK